LQQATRGSLLTQGVRDCHVVLGPLEVEVAKRRLRPALYWPVPGPGVCAVRKCCTISGGIAIDN
jgi:hypothetical protein